MANPKRRHSTSRQNRRRAMWKLEKPPMAACPQCNQPKMPHFMCSSCGYYDGREIVNIEKEKERKKKKP